jgi:hypothetical protein
VVFEGLVRPLAQGAQFLRGNLSTIARGAGSRLKIFHDYARNAGVIGADREGLLGKDFGLKPTSCALEYSKGI